MKILFIATVGTIGALVVTQLGGWRDAFLNLIVLMIIDYLTGLILASVFKTAKNVDRVALNSDKGFQGIMRKIMMLVLVLVANIMDGVFLDSTFVTHATIIAFMANEVISIVENVGLMGVPIPGVIKEAIHVLNEKSEGKGMPKL